MEIFWRTIAYYNSATWLLQIVIILIGIALTGLLIGRPRPWVKMAMKFYMIGLYTWISLVYYYIYCEERSYNGVMACLLYTSPSPRDRSLSRMPSSA